jgi:hypothetical protein
MNQIPDPNIANIVYNFLGTTLAQLNEIDKHNVGGSSLKAVKTDPKNVFRVNADAGTELLPDFPMSINPPQMAPQPPAMPMVQPHPQATTVAAPPEFVANAMVQSSIPIHDKRVGKEIDNIIIALTNIKNILNE